MLSRRGGVDMDTRILAAECTGAELVYLSQFLGGDAPLGLENPFQGVAQDVVDRALREARASLIARRYLIALPDERVDIDPGLAVLVRAAMFPYAVLLLRGSTAAGDVESPAFYLRSPLAVEVAPMGPSAYRLQMLEGMDAIVQRISELWQLVDQRAAPGAPGLVPEATLQAARRLAVEQGSAEASAALALAGLEEATAGSLAETLKDPHRNAAIVALRPGELAWQVAGLGILDGGNGLWRLRSVERGGEPWVEVVPTDAPTLIRELDRLLASFAPDEQSAAAT